MSAENFKRVTIRFPKKLYDEMKEYSDKSGFLTFSGAVIYFCQLGINNQKKIDDLINDPKYMGAVIGQSGLLESIESDVKKNKEEK